MLERRNAQWPTTVGAALEAPEEAGIGASLQDAARVVYRWRLLALGVFLLILLAGLAYTYSRVPMYDAQAQVLIEGDDPNVVNFKAVTDDGSSRGDYYQTQYELLRSRALARRTLTSLGLLGPREGAQKTPARGPDAATTETQDEAAAIDDFLYRLQITPVRASRLVNIRFRMADPGRAAAFANAHAREYIQSSLEVRAAASAEASQWLRDRVEEERKHLQQSEDALQTYREQHGVSLEAGQNIVVQKLSELNTALTQAKTQRLDAEAKYRQLAALPPDQLESFPAILSNPLIQELKRDLGVLQREYAELAQTLGSRHPRLTEKASAIATTESRLNAEIARVSESVRAQFQAAMAQENQLTGALDAQKREALAQNESSIEYAALKRESDSVRRIYEDLLQRAKETGVSTDLRATGNRIIDPAQIPRNPATPNKQVNLLATMLGGTILSLAFVFFVDMFDERIKNPGAVKNGLGLSLLALIPKVRRGQAGGDMIGGVPPAVEAFRALRSVLLHRSGGIVSVRSLVVTSTVRGEGKTVVAANLAIALAEAHQQVLLIDGDMRAPRLHRFFGEEIGPGLSEVLSGEIDLERVLRPTNVPGLTVVTAGAQPRDPTDLLGSAAFKALVVAAEGKFNHVVIDTPPVMAVADAVVAGHAAAAVLFVVGADKTSYRAAALAIEQLRQAGHSIVGAVLNGIDLGRHPFYYSPYHRHDYGSSPKSAATRNRLSIS